MLKGDLTTTPLVTLLLNLAEEEATGCLHIGDSDGDEALVYVKAGLIYAVSVPGRRPQLGARLISSGALGPEALSEALEAQRTELQGWRLGELLVHLGYVDQPVVEAFVEEQVRDAMWDLSRWSVGKWKFRKNVKTREDVARPTSVDALLEVVRERQQDWEVISATVHGPTAVPMLAPRGGGQPELTLDPDAWSLLCKIDGDRSVAELARECGYTVFEAARVLVTLVQAGLVDVEEDLEAEQVPAPQAVDESLAHRLVTAFTDPDAQLPDPQTQTISDTTSEPPGDDPAPEADLEPADLEPADDLAPADDFDEESEPSAPAADLDDLARLVSQAVASGHVIPVPDVPSPVQLRPLDDHDFAASIARVSAALSEVLGPAASGADPFDLPSGLRPSRPSRSSSAPAPAPIADPEWERRERLRQAAAAELSAAHAMAEALRRQQDDFAGNGSAGGGDLRPLAQVVDLDTVRRESARREADELDRAAEERTRGEAERLASAVEVEAAADAAARAAEMAAAAADAIAAEADRHEAERQAAEQAAAEQAERLAAEEAERLAAEEAERLEVERLAAEEAARLENERLAAEEAAWLEAEEAARLAAEEAARLEAEEAARLAAEEADRLETERLAAEEAARLETERLAAEEAARLENERLAAEEADRLAAEEADRLETEGLAAEEAERLAATPGARAAAAAHDAAQREGERLAAQLAAELADAESASRQQQTQAAFATLVDFASADVLVATAEEPEDTSAGTFDAAPQTRYTPDPSSGGTDTAALLRELSSLGVEDDPNPPPLTPLRMRPIAVADKKKKKRGLFGL